MATKLQIRCAWCGKDMGEKDGEGEEGTSDGICDDCLLKNFPHVYEKIKKEELWKRLKDTVSTGNS